MTTYGNLKGSEWKKLKDSLVFEERGKWYRITDHHVIPSFYGPGEDRVNYQAEEMTDHDVGAMQAERESPKPEKPFTEPVLLEPEPPPEIVDIDYGAPQGASLTVETPSVVSAVPTLQQYAFQRGWAPRYGPITQDIKDRWARDFPRAAERARKAQEAKG